MTTQWGQFVACRMNVEKPSGRRNGFAGRQGFVDETRSWIRKNSGGEGAIRLNSCESSYKPIPAPKLSRRRRFCRTGRRGFTMLELAVVTLLMTVLALVMAYVWRGFAHPLVETVARCHVAREAGMACAYLARDAGAHESATGKVGQGCRVGQMIVAGSQLWLCYDGGTEPNGIPDWGTPDQVIIYELETKQLVRRNNTTGDATVVAASVDQLDLADVIGGIQIDLTFSYHNLTRTWTMIIKEP